MFDGSMNYLVGITSNSIKFSTIIQKIDYKELYDLNSFEIELIDEFRKLRNQIHLHGDFMESPKKDQIDDFFEFMATFFNKHLVQKHNNIMIEFENTYRIDEIKLF